LIRSVDWEIKSGYKATKDLLDQKGEARPTAIIYGNTQLLLGGYKALREKGLSIPYDIAVASFEHPDIIDALSPCPTTLEKVETRIGRTAAEMLFSIIESKENLPTREIYIPSQLVIGESCGCSKRL